jgi:hypothetical protein
MLGRNPNVGLMHHAVFPFAGGIKPACDGRPTPFCHRGVNSPFPSLALKLFIFWKNKII